MLQVITIIIVCQPLFTVKQKNPIPVCFLLSRNRLFTELCTNQSVHKFLVTPGRIHMFWSFWAGYNIILVPTGLDIINFMVLRLISESVGRKTGILNNKWITKFSNSQKVSHCASYPCLAKNKEADVTRRSEKQKHIGYLRRAWPPSEHCGTRRPTNNHETSQSQPLHSQHSAVAVHRPHTHSRHISCYVQEDYNRLQNGGEAAHTINEATCCRQGFSHKNADIHQNRWS